jgi:hypothetical protein
VSDPLGDDAEQDKYVRDHDCSEQLEEVFDPKVNDPKSPEISSRECRFPTRQQAYGVERPNC